MIVDRNKITYMVMGTTPPHSTEVLWLDTSYSAQPVLKWYNNGEWVPITTDTLVEDEIVGMYVIKEPTSSTPEPTVTINITNPELSDFSEFNGYLDGGKYLITVHINSNHITSGGLFTVQHTASGVTQILHIDLSVLGVKDLLFYRMYENGAWSPVFSTAIPVIDDSSTTSTTETWSAKKINDELVDIEEDVTNHGSAIETIQGDIEELQGDVEGIGEDIEDINDSIEDINDNIEDINDDISDLNTAIDKVRDFMPMEVTSTAVDTIVLKPGVYHWLEFDVSTLTIELQSYDNENNTLIGEYHLYFYYEGSSVDDITLPSSVTWVGGTPTFETENTYEIDILNNIGICVKV